MGDRTGYVKPDSALVRAADDLLSRHSAQPGGLCPSCGQLSPCPSARHAVEVRRAAGLSVTDGVGVGNAGPSGAEPSTAGPVPGGHMGPGPMGAGPPGFASPPGYAGPHMGGPAPVSGAGANAGPFGGGAGTGSTNQPATHASAPVGLSKVPARSDED